MSQRDLLQTPKRSRPRWLIRLLAVLAILGPGLIAANAGNDAGGILTYASAGHLRPLLIENSHARFLDTERGMPLGIAPGDYSEAQVQLPPGSLLLFYSDGITEAANLNEEEYGIERLAEHFLQPEASAETILEDVRSFSAPATLNDDATVIVIRAGV